MRSFSPEIAAMTGSTILETLKSTPFQVVAVRSLQSLIGMVLIAAPSFLLMERKLPISGIRIKERLFRIPKYIL
jgi:hypothetical protein